jgi:peroxiredoxin Q/BCP
MPSGNTITAGRALVLLSALACGCGKTASAEETPRGDPRTANAGALTTQPSAPNTPAAAEPALAVGTPAPDVTLTLQDGFGLALLGLKGKVVVLFFCSRAEDPACLATARGFATEYSGLYGTHRIVLVGVTADSAETHRALIKREKLPFDLASDADGKLAHAFALPSHGEQPLTLVVGRDAKIRSVWRASDPRAQAQQILEAARVPVPGETALAE